MAHVPQAQSRSSSGSDRGRRFVAVGSRDATDCGVRRPTPVTTVYVSSTDGLVRSVVVAGATKGTQTIVGSTGVGGADSLLFEPTGKLILTGLGSPNIYRLDPTAPGGAANTGTQVNTTPLAGSAADPAIDAAGINVYVTNFGNGINVVNRSTGAVTTHSLSGISEISGIAFDTTGQLWVTDFSGHTVGLANLSLNTYTPLCVGVATGIGGPDGLSFDPASGELYVSGQANNTITQLTIGPSLCVVSHVFSLVNFVHPDGIAADGIGGVYMAGQTGTLERLDTLTSAEDVIATGISGLDDIAPAFGLGAPDTTGPTCALTAVIAGPPKQLQITVQDTGSGLGTVVATTAVNASVAVPAFTPGATSAVVATATKINQSLSAQVGLTVTDVAGNVTVCDPVLTTFVRDAGKPETQTFSGLARAESKVTIMNDANGVKKVELWVNGNKFKVADLANGQTTTIDMAAAMRAGNNNTIEIRAIGPKGSSLTVVIHE